MPSRPIRYRPCADLRVREVPEMELCLAYSPGQAQIFTLDALGWFLLRACKRRTLDELVESYAEVMEGARTPLEARSEIESAMSRLQHWGIVSTDEPARRVTTRRSRHAEKD